jgi:diacylglycerol kinase (ATP)
LSKFEVVKTRKITYDLPILIIYNPISGKQANLVPLIETRLKLEKIPYEFMATKKRQDTYHFAKDVDLSKYSLLVAAGGDGSYHEVVNGMLSRPDKLKLPIAMFPNGSGNDTCTAIGVKTLDDALNYIVNAEVIALDTVRCLIDYDEFE